MFKAVVGLQFGDEGKGKFVDFMATNHDYIARYNGGANAGHTVNVNGKQASFSQIPATLENNKMLFVCQDALISLEKLSDELEFIKVTCKNSKVYIDPRCHIVLPIHVELNRASEDYKGKKKIGSVGVGVGACFEDKSNRLGIRLIDATNKETLKEKLKLLWDIRAKQISNVFNGKLTLDFESECNSIYQLAKGIEPYFSFTNDEIHKLLSNNKDILLETSQATFLDNSFGTYPYTVAYHTLVQSCFTSIGVPAHEMYVLGVMKAYTIRVGNGPLPTEFNDEKANRIRTVGNEFGTVSKRPRRIGWLDLVLVKHALKLTGTTEIAITNIDVLSELKEIPVCVGYTLDGEDVCANKALIMLDKVEPVYKVFSSWPTLNKKYESINLLPKEAIDYLSFIEHELGVRIKYVSYGKDREQTIEVSSYINQFHVENGLSSTDYLITRT
ncbi:adenylosuccinate synthase [Photobacterium leiognathi subsp. mandapamensis]